MSAPRLPPGITFSKTLRPIQNEPFTRTINGVAVDTDFWNLGHNDYSGLRCPYLNPKPSPYLNPKPGLRCPYLLSAGATDDSGSFLEWYLDPAYTMFYGCQCDAVSLSGRYDWPYMCGARRERWCDHLTPLRPLLLNAQGTVATWSSVFGLPVMTCGPIPAPVPTFIQEHSWIIIVVVLVATAILVAVAW